MSTTGILPVLQRGALEIYCLEIVERYCSVLAPLFFVGLHYVGGRYVHDATDPLRLKATTSIHEMVDPAHDHAKYFTTNCCSRYYVKRIYS